MFLIRLFVLFLLLFVEAKAGVEEFLSWMNSSCFDVHIKLKGCIKIKHGHVKFGLKTTYWLPIGIMEVTDKACDFSLEIPPFDEIEAPLKTLCNSLPYLQSNPNMNSPLVQTHARYQVHVYTIPPILYPVIRQALMMSHFVPCFDFGVGDVLKVCSTCQQLLDKALAPVEAVQGKVNQYTQKIKNKVDSIVPDSLKTSLKKLKGNSEESNDGESEDYVSKVKSVYTRALAVSSVSPVFFSELVSPIWNVDVLSPDVYTVAPVISAVISSGGIVTEGACDISTSLLRRKMGELGIGGVDLSFVCVGNWGHGYPRTGIVRTDNPLIGLPLAGARFLHLFSTTIPMLSHFNVHSIKLQYVSPVKTGCFFIGDHTIPFRVGSNELNLLSLDWKQVLRNLRASPTNRHRAVFLIWKKFSCCKF